MVSTVGNRLSEVADAATRTLILSNSLPGAEWQKFSYLFRAILALGFGAVNGKSVPFAHLGKLCRQLRKALYCGSEYCLILLYFKLPVISHLT